MAVPVNESSLLCNSSTLDSALDWCFRVNHLNYIVVCFEQELIPQNGLWQVSSGKNVTFKTFIVQLALIICINRLLISLFRTLHLPHIAAEILGGLLLGTSGIAKTPLGFGVLYPPSEVVLLETVAHLGLVFYMFMVGLEMDIKPILKTPKEALIVAAFGFILPLPVGCALHYMFAGNAANFGPVVAQYGPIFWGLALSTTNFPDLAQILEDTKLLHSEIGRTALSAAAVTDIFSWAILVITISIVKGVHVYTIVFGSIFVVFSLTVLPPILNWFLQRRRRHDDFYFYYDDDYHIYLVLIGVVIYGYVTDFLGLHSIIGAFLFGLIMPKQGELRRVLMERVEDFVTGIMMPLFFLIIGLRTNRQDVFEGQFRMSTIVGVIVLAFGVKITSTFIAAVFCNKMSPRDGLALGFLMNTKGMLSLIVINSARNVKVLNNQTFTMIIIALWCMTIAVCPILTMTYKKSLKQSKKRMHRSLTSLQPTSELRVLTCFHSSYEVTGIINLLDASNPTRYSPISVYAIRLIENFGRTTAINIVHGACKPINMKGGEDHKEHAAFAAFNGFKNGNKEGIFIQPLTAVSAPATMHEHICDFAEENHANMVILPFHLKTITNVGKTGSSATNHSKTNLDFRNINKKVMAKCSCSVAILVDRGHRPPTAASVQAGHNFLVLFVGGPDDREVLAYVQRMSGSRNVALTVMRFVAAANTEDEEDFFFDYKEEKEKLLDEQYFEEFRHKMYENPLVSFTQAVVRNVEEIVRAIGTIEKEYDLIIVGKGRGGRGSLSKMLGEAEKEWSDYPELGLLGDTLVCSNFASNAWILVVQQASGCDVRLKDEHLGSCGKLSQHCAHMTWQPSVNEKPELALFVSRA